MSITLQTLIDETALYTKTELTTSGSAYDDDSQLIVDRFIAGINDAKNIIAKRKYKMVTSENITLNSSSCFDVANLSKTFLQIISIKYNDIDVYCEPKNGLIYCDAPALATVTAEYCYIPDDLTALTDTYPFPDSIDYRILCYRASAMHYEIRGGQSDERKAQMWTSKFNDALRDINSMKTANHRIRVVYDYGV